MAAVEELRTTRDVLHTEMIEVISAAEQRRDDESRSCGRIAT